MPIISVIMPVYNSQEFLQDSIESILQQTFSDFEFIIIDDASTDNSLGIIQEYAKKDKRIRLITNPNNLGVTETITIGIHFSTGEFIARMDADDISISERLERQYAYMQSHPEIDVVGSNAVLIDKQGNPLGKQLIVPSDPIMIWLQMFFQSRIIHPSSFARSNLYKRFNENGLESHFLHSEDYAFWMRMGFDHKYANLDVALLKYRIHGNSISQLYKETQQANHLKAARQAYQRLLNRDLGTDVLRLFVFPQLYHSDDSHLNVEALRTLYSLARTFTRRYSLTSTQRNAVSGYIFGKIYVFSAEHRQDKRVVLEGVRALFLLSPVRFLSLIFSSLKKRILKRSL